MNQSRWKFSIDVGGTFTDCVAHDPQGELHRGKVLSSGVTKGRIQKVSSSSSFQDESRKGDPQKFWIGVKLRILNSSGIEISDAVVTTFENQTGEFSVDRECPLREGLLYELCPGEEAPIQVIRKLLRLKNGQPLPSCDVRLGTTRGTNALLTRSGSRTLYLTTLGFKDALEIGYQDRPDLFALNIEKPANLYDAVLEVEERVSADGTILQELSPESVRKDLESFRQQGIESVAICLLHGDRFPNHERLLMDLARAVGYEEVCASHQVSPLIKLIVRGETTTLDAYLNPYCGLTSQGLSRTLARGARSN